MTISEIKEFIEWAKLAKLKHFKNSEFEFELSDLAFVEELVQSQQKEMMLGSPSDMLDTLKADPITEDPDLFWSAK